MQNTIIFIDAAYLSKILKNYNFGKYYKKIDIILLANTLCKINNLWCKKIYYYDAPPYQSSNPSSSEIFLKSNYDKFIFKLRKNNVIVKEGRCQKIDSKYTQKGVATLLTRDLSVEPIIHNYKQVILITGDSDFVPVINKLKEKQIDVILCYYSDRVRNSMFSMSNHLLNTCDRKILLDYTIFDKCILKNKNNMM